MHELEDIVQESEQNTIEQNEILLPAFHKIIVEFSDALTLKELADACSLSVNYFSSEFRKVYGLTPIRYLNRFRVGIAAQLLTESNISITDIGCFVGFGTPSDLYRNFTSVYGVSPSDYRAHSVNGRNK